MTRHASLAAVVLLAVTATPAAAQSAPAQLEQVRAQIRSLEARLASMVRQQADLSRERQRLEGELGLAELRVRESEAEIAQVRAAERAAVTAVEDANRALTAAADRLRAQVTMLSVLGRAGLRPLVYHAILSGADLQRRVTLLRALVRDQEARREELARLAEQRAGALATLSLRRSQVEQALDSLEARRGELGATRQRVVAELASLERRRRAEAAVLADARESEARLERLWGLVSQRADRGATDISLLRGGLPWPVQDFRLVTAFGRNRDPRYGTVTVSHGLTLAVPAGRQVAAVAEGTVAYAQFFKGYGNLVIVDHGSRVFSLYAQLSSMLVRPGQRVATGDPVGVAGATEEGGGNLYLEVRVGETAQDPRGWLRPVRR